MSNIFVKTKNTNGIWNVSDSFKTELAKLSGAEPCWKVLWTPTENEADWIEVGGLVSVGSIRKEVERELHTFMAMSANLVFDNTKGQWDRRGFWQNLSGDFVTECRITDETKDSIEGLGTDEYYLEAGYDGNWIGQALVLFAWRMYTTADGERLYAGCSGRVMRLQNETWTEVPNTQGYDISHKDKLFLEANGNVYFSSGNKIYRDYGSFFFLTKDLSVSLYKRLPYGFYVTHLLGMGEWGGMIFLYCRYNDGYHDIICTDTCFDPICHLSQVSGAINIFGDFISHNGEFYLATNNSIYQYTDSSFALIASMPDNATESKKFCICQDKLFINHTSAAYNRIYSINEEGIVIEKDYNHPTYGSITDLVPMSIDRMLIFFSGTRKVEEYTPKNGFHLPTNGEIYTKIAAATQGAIYKKHLFAAQWVYGTSKAIFNRCLVYKNHAYLKSVHIYQYYEHTNIIAGMTIVFDFKGYYRDCTVVNLGLFGSRNVYEEKIRIWKGYKLANGNYEFVPAFTGMVDRVDTSDTGGTATVSLIDLNKKLAQVTAETVTMDGSDGTLTTKLNISTALEATGGYGKGLPKGATKIPVLPPIDKFPTAGKIKINNEVITYASKIETALDTSFNGCDRGADLTIDDNHTDGATVSNNQWYIAPRTDMAVERLLQEANITDYQIDTTTTIADFEHFSYHGKTPPMPPFGVCRCMCYDAVRDRYWMGVDDMLYLWQDSVWTLAGVVEAGSYIYQIAVWEDNGEVYFVTCSNNGKYTQTWDNDMSDYINTFRLWGFIPDTQLFFAINSTIGENYLFYGISTGWAWGDVRYTDYNALPAGGFFIGTGAANGRLFFKTIFVQSRWYEGPTIKSVWYRFGACYLNLTTREVVAAMNDVSLLERSNAISCPCDADTTGAVLIVATPVSNSRNIQIDSYSATGDRIRRRIISISNLTMPVVFISGILAISPCSLSHIDYAIALFYWQSDRVSRHETISIVCYVTDYTDVAITLSTSAIVDQRSPLPDIVLNFIIRNGDSYFVKGNPSKLHRIHREGLAVNLLDIGTTVVGQQDTASSLCLGMMEGQQAILGVSAPSYALWQYSKHSVISAFNSADFTANFGITPISEILKSLAISSGFVGYFDEFGKYYFVKTTSAADILAGFAENDITQIAESSGNLAEYPIVNKAIVSLFDGTTQIMELPITSESRIKFGLETMTLSNPWLNNAGVANGLAKEIVAGFALPKSILEMSVRWYPMLQLNKVITIIKPTMGIWVKPQHDQTLLLPTITAGMRWQLLEVTEMANPPGTSVRVRQI